MTLARQLPASTLHSALGRARGRPAPIAAIAWWLPIAAILVGMVVFHSRLDPSDRVGPAPTAPLGGGPLFYRPLFGGFTPADALVIAFAYCAGLQRVRRRTPFSRLATGYTIAIALAIAAGVAVGLAHGTTRPFGDWRNLAIGALFAFGLWSTVLGQPGGAVRLARLFVTIVVGYGLIELATFAAGSGAVAFYGRTPTANHATLEFMVAAAAISVAMLAVEKHRRHLWWAGLAVGTAIVVLSFRRYAWVELAIVFAVLAAAGAVRKRYLFAMLLVTALVPLLPMGSSLDWSARLASLDPYASKSQNELAATNQGHLDDILDGLDQVRNHPVVGLGVGVTYVGKRTISWKGVAGMVHNGLVEVWIKFGIFGLVLYLLTYLQVFSGIWSRRRRADPAALVALGAGAALFGAFVISVTVYSWAFGVPERAILAFLLLALAYPRGYRRPTAVTPSVEGSR